MNIKKLKSVAFFEAFKVLDVAEEIVCKLEQAKLGHLLLNYFKAVAKFIIAKFETFNTRHHREVFKRS